MILFGGAEAINSTWALTLGASPTWTNLNPSAFPSGRKAMSLIYDSTRQRVVLFGGYDNNYQADVWAFDLSGPPAWQQLSPGGTPPSGRMFTVAVYDAPRDRMLVFGGHPQELNDVWALNFTTLIWEQIFPSGGPPSPRYGHVGVYDPVGDRLVVFGGTSGGDEAWALSLSGSPSWTQLATSGPRPSARYYTAAVYDPLRTRMVVYGGGSGDAWALSLEAGQVPSWQLLASTGTLPPARQLHTAIYQDGADRMIVYGPGTDVLALTWDHSLTVPVVTSFVPAGGRVGDPIQLLGLSLAGATEVSFNGALAPIFENSSTRILTAVPPGATTGPVWVRTGAGIGTSADTFFVGETPEITAAVPESAKVGRSVRLLGRHFTRTLKVSFGGVSDAPFTLASDSVISAVVDSGAITGPISVTTLAATGTSGFTFRVIPPDTSARIVAVRDVMSDQGGRVVVGWLGSELDIPPRRFIAGYRVWRRAMNVAAGAGHAKPGWRRQVMPTGEVVFWEPMATVPASYLEGYAFTSPTNQDSIAGSNPYTAFFIQTLTADPFVFYSSPVDSGYSVDNLSPPTPMPFTASYSAGGNALHWGTSRAPDLREFLLHRGSSIDFAPEPSNLILASRDTGYVDAPGAFYYKLGAVDIHGNASHFALVGPATPSATLAPVVSVDAQVDRVRLVWYAADGPEMMAVVYRRVLGSAWGRVGVITEDGTGYLRYEDVAVTRGTRYGYRLGVLDGEAEVFAGETWVEVPGLELALVGLRPNPSVNARPRMEFILRDETPARLEVVDVAGRMAMSSQVGHLGAGRHTVDLADGVALSPGVYFLRLTQGGKEVRARAVVLR